MPNGMVPVATTTWHDRQMQFSQITSSQNTAPSMFALVSLSSVRTTRRERGPWGKSLNA